MHLPSFREYAKAVYAATDAYVSSLGPADLERKVDTGFVGEQTIAFVLGNIVVWHVAEHNGEIGALKGAQGSRGYRSRQSLDGPGRRSGPGRCGYFLKRLSNARRMSLGRVESGEASARPSPGA